MICIKLVCHARNVVCVAVTLGFAESLVENARFGSKSRGVQQECPDKSVKQECPAKSVQQECLARASTSKSVPQKCQSKSV